MYTDANHLRVDDPGRIEGNVVFTYLDAFGKDEQKIHDFKQHYQKGGLGDVVLKKYLFEVLNELLMPIRTRRNQLSSDKGQIMKILLDGTAKTREVAAGTMREVRHALKLDY